MYEIIDGGRNDSLIPKQIDCVVFGSATNFGYFNEEKCLCICVVSMRLSVIIFQISGNSFL